ncbi:MAG: aldose epimerase family protein [Marinosulfonomonas sp.]
MTEQIELFGQTKKGEDIHRITLTDETLTVRILTLGAILQDVRLPDVPYSLTLGGEDPEGYATTMAHYGAVVGPVANRISGASTRVDGILYEFEPNEAGTTTVHGGLSGTQRQVWTLVDHTKTSARLQLDLKDGHGGFPGNRSFGASFEITGPGQLTLTLTATTDRTTPINLANHSYWNLDGTKDTLGQTLTVEADQYLPTDAASIPTGEIASVDSTEFDFRNGRDVGAERADRLNHTLCLSKEKTQLRDVATLQGKNGVAMTFATTETGLHLYDAAFVSSAPFMGFQGTAYDNFAGIALEAQGRPDAPNKPNFPQINVTPDAPYRQVTRWTFRN